MFIALTKNTEDTKKNPLCPLWLRERHVYTFPQQNVIHGVSHNAHRATQRV